MFSAQNSKMFTPLARDITMIFSKAVLCEPLSTRQQTVFSFSFLFSSRICHSLRPKPRKTTKNITPFVSGSTGAHITRVQTFRVCLQKKKMRKPDALNVQNTYSLNQLIDPQETPQCDANLFLEDHPEDAELLEETAALYPVVLFFIGHEDNLALCTHTHTK